MAAPIYLQVPVDADRDHIRGGGGADGRVVVVSFGDFLCPYCRRLRTVLRRLRAAIGERFEYVFRHFPNEVAHPGADFAARASEAAADQGLFWEMHDGLFDCEPPLTEDTVRDIARRIGLDMTRFEADVAAAEVERRIADSIADARANGVTGTPTLFIDGVRYDGAWDFHSILDVLEKPVALRIQRSAGFFANLPASGGLVLLLAALAALLCANSPLAPQYHAFVQAPFGVGPPGSLFFLTIGDWFSEGLLAVFFLIVGLEIRREMTSGALSEFRAAMLPVLAAVGGAVVPALVYLAFNRGSAAAGWSVPTATDIAFALGVLALIGDRVPPGIKIFVAAYAVADDILSVLTLAIFYPRAFAAEWLIACGAAMLAMYALSRWRVYATWPYIVLAAALWFFLHSAGVHAALAGIVLAAFLPTRPTPDAAPLLAQAATALAALEHEQSLGRADGRSDDDNPVLDWASRNLSAAAERLLSPADRIERSLAPWSTYLALPLFAFSATGVGLDVDLSTHQAQMILLGVVAGLVVGKPVGVVLAAAAAVKTRIASLPDGTSPVGLLAAACLCGIGDTVSLLLADEAFPGASRESDVAKIGVLIGSVLAAALGAAILVIGNARTAMTEAEDA